MKSQLKYFLLISIFGYQGHLGALDAFQCLRDLMPITDVAAARLERSGVEMPFQVNDRYLAFPEVDGGRVVGFYMYSGLGAWHFDAVQPVLEGSGPTIPLAGLESEPHAHETVYHLVVQPGGSLEVVTLNLTPGLHGTVRAGSKRHPAIYQQPNPLGSSAERTMRLISRAEGDGNVRAPLEAELRLRQAWLRSHNLDQARFKAWMKLMDRSCKGSERN